MGFDEIQTEGGEREKVDRRKVIPFPKEGALGTFTMEQAKSNNTFEETFNAVVIKRYL